MLAIAATKTFAFASAAASEMPAHVSDPSRRPSAAAVSTPGVGGRVLGAGVGRKVGVGVGWGVGRVLGAGVGHGVGISVGLGVG